MTERPNFSCIWCADFCRSEREINAPQATVIQIEHNEPEFLLASTHAAEDIKDTISLRLSTDGNECVHRNAAILIRSVCVWEGNSLLLTSRIISGQSQADNVVRYTLSSDGGEIVADETYCGHPKSYHNQWVMVRK